MSSAALVAKMLLAISLFDSNVFKEKCEMLFLAIFLLEASMLTEHVHKYESASYYHHTIPVFTLKQKVTPLSGEPDGG